MTRPMERLIRARPPRSMLPAGAGRVALDPEPDHDERGGDHDRRDHQDHGERGRPDERAGGDRADDHGQLEGTDEDPGRSPGELVATAAARRTPVDDGDLHRQPHDVGALDREPDQERREPWRERQDPRPEGGDRGREEQHVARTDQVAQPREERHRERGDDQLGRLEPVDAGVVDGEVLGDVLVDRRVVALQDAAGQLDADQETDDRSPSPCTGLARRRAPTRVAATGESLDQPAVPVDPGQEVVDAEVLVVGVDGLALGGGHPNGAKR